jgi:pseudaminic acid synthase
VKTINIGDFHIGKNYPPFIIAEMSGNHNHSIDQALKIVDEVAKSGAHALKLQTYTPDTLTIDVSTGDFFISDSSSLWKGNSLYELYKKAYTPWEWHEVIFRRAKEHGIICFSTPFDDTAVDFLETLNVPAYKIASFENNHLPLLKKVAKTGKPVIMSTGLSDLNDINLAIDTLRSNGCKDIILLKCTSTYPSTPENTNLLTIPHMSQLFDCHVGLSDHTMGIGVSLAAIGVGARVIEKHFTLDRSEGGVDSTFSMEPNEFKLLVEESKKAFDALGSIHYGILPDELKSKKFKRSIYIVKDLNKGDILTKDNIRIIRPGNGVSPSFFDTFIGKRINKSVNRGTALSFDLIG